MDCNEKGDVIGREEGRTEELVIGVLGDKRYNFRSANSRRRLSFISSSSLTCLSVRVLHFMSHPHSPRRMAGTAFTIPLTDIPSYREVSQVLDSLSGVPSAV